MFVIMRYDGVPENLDYGSSRAHASPRLQVPIGVLLSSFNQQSSTVAYMATDRS